VVGIQPDLFLGIDGGSPRPAKRAPRRDPVYDELRRLVAALEAELRDRVRIHADQLARQRQEHEAATRKLQGQISDLQYRLTMVEQETGISDIRKPQTRRVV
jgi:hypothetical protein